MKMNQIITSLNEKYPHRNWGEIVRRYMNGETIQTAQKMAIERMSRNTY